MALDEPSLFTGELPWIRYIQVSVIRKPIINPSVLKKIAVLKQYVIVFVIDKIITAENAVLQKMPILGKNEAAFRNAADCLPRADKLAFAADIADSFKCGGKIQHHPGIGKRVSERDRSAFRIGEKKPLLRIVPCEILPAIERGSIFVQTDNRFPRKIGKNPFTTQSRFRCKPGSGDEEKQDETNSDP